MRVLVCGGRDFADRTKLFRTLDELDEQYQFTTVIQGGARGADAMAFGWALSRFREVQEFKADWKRDGKAAGPLRNQRMIDEGRPGFVVAFSGGRGTADMVRRARKAGVKVIEVPSPDTHATDGKGE